MNQKFGDHELATIPSMKTNHFSILRLPFVRELVAAMLAAGLSWQCAQAAAPGWWQQHGLMKAGGAMVDDFAVLNQGQLKNFARASIYELHEKLPGGAGPLLNQLLQTWRTHKLNADDFTAVNVGQLKAVAKPVYAAMQSAGLSLPLPWTSLTEDDNDYAVANLGQAKAVFAFVLPDYLALGLTDSDGDGFSDALELTLGSNHQLDSSTPPGISGDIPTDSGSGLPPYINPYPEPWPDFTTPSPTTDTDQDGVPDLRDAVPYDRNFNHPRSGVPHYNVIDLGPCRSFMDMADDGALLWQESSSPKRYKVWSPTPADQPAAYTWTSATPSVFSLSESTNMDAPQTISEGGLLFGEAKYTGGLGAEPRQYTCNPWTQAATWLPLRAPDVGDEQNVLQSGYWFTGPGGLQYGSAYYKITKRDDDGYIESFEEWIAHCKISSGGVTFEKKELLVDKPKLPSVPEETNSILLGTAKELDPRYEHNRYAITGSGTGVIRVTHDLKFKMSAIYGIDVFGTYFWDYDLSKQKLLDNKYLYELVTAQQTLPLFEVNLGEAGRLEDLSWDFRDVSPAAVPWIAGYSRVSRRPYIWKPSISGAGYHPYPIYAGHADYQTSKPIEWISLLTAQGQAIVYGEFDADSTGEESGLWADGEVQPMHKLISGYERYTNWSYYDVSRDGMIASTAYIGTQRRMLLLIPMTTREILADGSIAPAGNGVQASMPSPVFGATVAADGSAQGTMSCALQNIRVLADGSVLGDLQVSGSLASKACDNVRGEKGTITQAQLWVNGADTAQATITVQPSKQTSGTRVRPYPYAGTFDTTIANVPLTAGVNTFKFTAADPVYHMPGYSTWSATVVVTDPEEEGGGTAGTGLTAITLQLPAAMLSSSVAETVAASFTLPGSTAITMPLAETAVSSAVFTGTLASGLPARLTLVNAAALTLTKPDALLATLLLGEPGSAQSFTVPLTESTATSGLFAGGDGSSLAGGGTGTGGTGTGGTGTGGTGTGGTGTGTAVTAAVSADPYERLRELAKSNGGEYHRYGITLGVPEAMLAHFQMAFGDETFGIMHDPEFGMVLEDPAQSGMPFMPSFTPTQQWGEQGPPAESDSDYAKRMTELEHASFAKGFAMGLGYGGYDMVTSTGKAIWGAAKFVGRAHLQVGLRFKWVGQWMTGGDTTRTEEMLVAVDAKQQEVIDQGLQVGKLLGTLLLDTAAVLPKIEVGLLTGDLGC